MATIHSEFSPNDTSVFARTLIEENDTAILGRLFPNKTQNSRYATWTETIPGGKNVALYRSHGTEVPFGEMSGGGREKSARIANLGLKLLYSEDDIVAVQEGVADEQAIIDRLTAEVTSSVMNAVNRMRADAFEKASFVLQGENSFVPVTFDRNPDLTTTAPALWTDPTADPILYISNLADKVQEESGVRPNTIITSTRVASELRRQAVMFAYAVQDKQVPFISHDAVQSVLASYGLPTLEVYDEVDYKGDRFFSDDKIFLTSSAGVGDTVWGPSTAARNSLSRGQAPGIYVGAYQDQDADTTYIRADATVMPILTNPNATAVAKVI